MNLTQPLAISMWDFSWLERRWPGAGYEDLEQALDELCERGYDAVRIDAYPHLILNDPDADYELIPCWGVNAWGATMRCRVRRIRDELIAFIRACAVRGIAVGLSSWFRRDTNESWRGLCTPARHAAAWIAVLDAIRDAGLLDHILYLDLCNEWPMGLWAPFFSGRDQLDAPVVADADPPGTWSDERSLAWLGSATAALRAAYPQLVLTTSFLPWGEDAATAAGFCDIYEPHLWMANGEFYRRLGWTFQHRWDNSEYELLARHGERLYRAEPDHWQGVLRGLIDEAAAVAASTGRALITTECWSVVDYKDGPLLDWGWVKELCALGTRHASATGAWAAIATSNFCGPQFVGMWRDIDWHRELTGTIKRGQLPASWPQQTSDRR